MCDPVATAGKPGSVPSQRANVFPTASSLIWSDAAAHRSLNHVRAARSWGEKTIRVTAGGGASENVASVESSDVSLASSTLIVSAQPPHPDVAEANLGAVVLQQQRLLGRMRRVMRDRAVRRLAH